jgi:hypothetical protein
MSGSDLKPLFDIPNLPHQHRLSVIYRKMMEKRYDLKALDEKVYPWDAKHFGLVNTTLYNKLDLVQQQSLVELLNERLFASFLYIEKSGLTFGAKMILVSETMEEKSLYAAFVEEESRHYMEFNRFANLTLEKEKHWLPMLDILGSAIMDAEKETMAYIIHTLMEGFSITHYQILMQGCQNPQLKESFQRILDDEGRHHAMGYTTKEKNVSQLVKDQVYEYTTRLLNTVRTSHPSIKAYELLFGELSQKELQLLKEETKSEERGSQRVQVFESIIKKNDYYGLIERLNI